MESKLQLLKKQRAATTPKKDTFIDDAVSDINHAAQARETFTQERRKEEQTRAATKDTNAIFAFDTTSSMSHCINEVTNNLGTIVENLVKEDGVSIMVAGVGEYGDSYGPLQIHDFTNNAETLQSNIGNIRTGGGGGACQVSLELFWQELNRTYIQEDKNYIMVVISDEIAHGQDGKESNPRADYKHEITTLCPSLKAFYFISCTKDERKIQLQKQLLCPDPKYNKLLPLSDMASLADMLPHVLVTLVKETQKPGAGAAYAQQKYNSLLQQGQTEQAERLQQQTRLALGPGK